MPTRDKESQGRVKPSFYPFNLFQSKSLAEDLESKIETSGVYSLLYLELKWMGIKGLKLKGNGWLLWHQKYGRAYNYSWCNLST